MEGENRKKKLYVPNVRNIRSESVNDNENERSFFGCQFSFEFNKMEMILGWRDTYDERKQFKIKYSLCV